MDIISYIFVTLVFIVIIYFLFIKKNKVEDEDNTNDTMLELKNKNDILEDKVNRLEKELSNYKEEIKKVDKLSNQVDTLDEKMESTLSKNIVTNTKDTIKTKNGFTITYSDEEKYKKLERNLKKCNMKAYRRLVFEYYPSIENGNYVGKLVKEDNNILVYELVLPTDSMFSKVHGDFKLIYSVNIDEKNIIYETIEPEDFLLEGYKDVLTAYKGVMVSKENHYKDIFKIDLLNRLEDDTKRKDKVDTISNIKHKNDKLEAEVNSLKKEIKKIDKLSNQVETLDEKVESMLNENIVIESEETIKTKNGFTTTYSDEEKYRKLEKSLRKYNMVAYKKLVFEYKPSIKNGNYVGELVKEDNNILVYELVLPTDSRFSNVHGDFKLIYSVDTDEKTIIFETIEPENILLEGYKNELTTYKGVMISKNNRDKDIFRINLLNMMENDNERKDK